MFIFQTRNFLATRVIFMWKERRIKRNLIFSHCVARYINIHTKGDSFPRSKWLEKLNFCLYYHCSVLQEAISRVAFEQDAKIDEIEQQENVSLGLYPSRY